MERTQIQHVLDYIEEHLKEELDYKMLAQIAGYSEYHFIRVFRQFVRLTPADYIRKRRISELVRRIREKNRSISELAIGKNSVSKETYRKHIELKE